MKSGGLISLSSYFDVGKGSWGEYELVKSSEEGSEEGVWFSDVDFSLVVQVEFGPGSWEELCHVSFHLGFGNLFGN